MCLLFCKQWTAFIVHDTIWLCYILLLLLLAPQYAIITSVGPGKIGIEDFLCKTGEPLWQLNKLRNKAYIAVSPSATNLVLIELCSGSYATEQLLCKQQL